jgi:hypothetical protein
MAIVANRLLLVLAALILKKAGCGTAVFPPIVAITSQVEGES